MKRWLRITLLWLLAAALPVQGWAAVTMALCGPTHHRMSQAAAVVHNPETHGHATHDHADHRGATDHDDGAHHVHGEVASNDTATAGANCAHGPDCVHHDAKFSKAKCGTCASCCTGTAIPTTLVSLKAAPQTFFVSPVLPRTSVTFLTAGPERPPRTILS
ncbi:MAG: hypothetical protein EPO01_21400 [Aquabacterium sp.]|nr:MAG: hypothetical protein EPO12_13610 [Aquabacterium sp.]TAL13488.1 MAG: hypothetical protein EPO01_21400 [Aquabacterium sp.]